MDHHWELLETGRFSEAEPLLAALLAAEPDNKGAIVRRAWCLMAASQPEAARAQLEPMMTQLSLPLESASTTLLYGVTLWWTKRYDEAIHWWRLATDARYTDSAGGIEPYAFLYFAGERRDNKDVRAEGLAGLRMLWKRPRARYWPGPIAGFLIGEMEEETFARRAITEVDILSTRQSCQADFWIGLSKEIDCWRPGYERGLLSAAARYKQAGSVINEKEYWLSLAELHLLNVKA